VTIREFIEKKCIKHIEFAKKCGIQKSAFSRYVNGTRTPDVITYLKIKKASGNLITQYDHIISELPKLAGRE
jgi:transcriptional regulator with XRE-family HTH domain